MRELENALARAVVVAFGDSIEPAHLDLAARLPPPRRARNRREQREREAEQTREALEATTWNVSEAARRLGIGRTTLYRRMHRHHLVDTG